MKNTIIIFTFLMLLVLSGRSAKGQGAGQAPSSDLSTLALTDKAGSEQEQSQRGKSHIYQGRIVRGIEIDSSIAIPSEVVELLKKHLYNQPLFYRNLKSAISIFFRMGKIADVKVYIQDGYKGGIKLKFRLQPVTIIQEINIIDNDSLKTSRITRLLDLKAGDEYFQDQLNKKVAAIISLYQRKGLPNAKITVNTRFSHSKDQVVLYLHIQEGEPVKIGKIVFKGDIGVTHWRLREWLEVNEGDIFDKESIEERLENLEKYYLYAGYLTVKVNPIKSERITLGKGIKLQISVDAGYRYKIDLSGNAKMSKSLLLKVIKDALKDKRLDRYSLERIRDKLHLFYQRYGFWGVKISIGFIQDKKRRQRRVTFLVEEGRQMKLRSIRFKGNRILLSRYLMERAKERLEEFYYQDSILQQLDKDGLEDLGLAGGRDKFSRKKKYYQYLSLKPWQIYVEKYFQQVSDELQDFYYSRGFLDAQVGEAKLIVLQNGTRGEVTFTIREGRQSWLESYGFQGNTIFTSQQLQEEIEDKAGLHMAMPLDTFKVNQARQAIIKQYALQGYLYCQVEEEMKFSLNREKATVLFKIKEGPEVKIGNIIIKGNTFTSENIIRDYLSFKSQQVYDPLKIEASQEELSRQRAISGVIIQPMNRELPEDIKDIIVSVKPRRPRAVEFKFGASKEDGIRGQLDYNHLNFGGYMLEFFSKIKFNYPVPNWLPENKRKNYGEVESYNLLERFLTMGVNYPKIYGVPYPLGLKFNIMHERENDFRLDQFSANLGSESRLWKFFSFNLNYEIEYNYYDSAIFGLGSTSGEKSANVASKDSTSSNGQANNGNGVDGQQDSQADIIKKGRTAGVFASVRPEFILDLRDDPFNPHKGLFLSLISDYYNSYYTEDPDSPGVSFVKMMGQIRVYLPLGKATTFALSGGVGKIYKISEEAQVPLHKKFYLGGRMSLRGFAERGVLPAEIMKQRLKRAKTEMVDIKKEWSSGGEAMVEFKGELRIPVVNNFYLGFFMDAGNIWQDPDNFDLSQLRSSTGTGLRYLTPVGPISVDFAFKLDPKKSLQEEDWMVHFSIGMF